MKLDLSTGSFYHDGLHGKIFVGVKVLDASNAEGKTSLVGDDSDNTIIAASGVTISFVNDSILQVNSNAEVTYQLANRSKFSADHEQSIWLTK